MNGFLILIGLTFFYLVFLILESAIYNKRVRQIPLRITVSGTRGKSSIVRTLASVFRAHGIKTLAKTTGSEAMYILPDGTLEKIKRKGLTTILEQKRLIAKALRVDAGCIITEIMSIHPENHKIETHKLIKPHLTVLSNFRADHTDVVGDSLPEISELFINDIYAGAVIIIPEEEINDYILNGIRQKNATLIPAKTGVNNGIPIPESIYQTQIPVNLDVVITLARHQGIPDETIIRGIHDAQLDIGRLEIFRLHQDNRKIWFVNSFAANDPVSTRQLIVKTLEILTPEFAAEPVKIGLLALRSDRGERSRQWLDYLGSDGKNLFNQTFVSGIHSTIFTRKLNKCSRLTSLNPATITKQIMDASNGDILVFGVANIHGLGENLIQYWKTITIS